MSDMELHDNDENAVTGQVLVVDDDRTTRALHRGILAKQFDVLSAESGIEALKACEQRLPDLVLLDIGMPDLDGIETCRRLRETASIPVIFVTAHESVEEHLKAYDAGGDDIVTKPVRSEILLRKVALAIGQHRKEASLAREKESLRQMAMNFLSSMGQNGILLNFMRASVACRSHRALAEKLLETTRELGVECSVMIRHQDGPTVLTSKGETTDLEKSILEKSSTMGRIFQFKHRLVVNYDRVSIIATNMPDDRDDPEQAGRLRDDIAILAETTEGLCDNVDMRLESMHRAEQLQIALGGAVAAIEALRGRYMATLADTSVMLRQMVGDVEKTYSWLGINQEQEEAISQALDQSTQRILALLAEQGGFEDQFHQVLEALRGGSTQNEADLF